MTLVFAGVVLYSLQLVLAENGSALSPAQGGDGMIGCNQESPVFGDVCLTGGNASSGELLVYSLSQEWNSVCREGFGYIEAQLACNQLGFPFVADIYEVQQPSSLASGVFTFFECPIQALDMSPPTLGNSNPPCQYQTRENSTLYCSGRTTGLTCNAVQNISEDHGAIIFQDVARFAFIGHDDDGNRYTAECTTSEPFCSGIHLVDSDNQAYIALIEDINFFVNLLMASFGCSMKKPSDFGVECNPEFGDPYLGSFSSGELELTVGTTSGELLIFDGEEWISVCSDGFGYLEAQVACTQLGFPFFSDLYAIEMPTTNSSRFLAAATCTGSESSLQNCHIQLADYDIHSACEQTVGLTCRRPWLGSTVGSILLVFPDEANLNEFTLIAPNDQYYITNCTTNRDVAYCAGVYQVDRDSNSVQSIIDHIQTSGESVCSLLAASPTDFGIVCPTVTAPDASTSPMPTPTITTSRSGEGPSIGIIAGVTASTIVLVTVILFVLVLLWYYSHRTTRTLTLEVKSPLGKSRYTTVPRRHRIISDRRSSLKIVAADWEIPFPCVTLQEEIGSGAFGLIYHGVIACSHQPDCVEIAVKVLKQHATDSHRRALLLEIDMMKTIGYHRHLVGMLGCCTSGNQLALIMEYIAFGNLQAFLRKQRTCRENSNPRVSTSIYADDLDLKQLDTRDQLLQTQESKGIVPEDGCLSNMELIQLARQIVLGMEHLSSLKIVHRDLATRNILIDHDMILKIADFGLARDIYIDPCYQMTSNDKLPIRWMAVESIVNREFTTTSDVWSFGVVLWEIVTYAAFPYYNMTNTEIIEKVPKGYRMPKPEECLDEMYEIMCACWRLKPTDRPLFTELLNMLDQLLDTGEYTALLGQSPTSTLDFESPV